MHYIIFGVFCVGLLLGGGIAHRVTSDSYEADMGKTARDDKKIFDENNERIDTLSNELEVAKSEKKVRYKTVTKYVEKITERPVYIRECIDDDGLRAINAAIGDRQIYTGESPAALREGDSAGGKDGRGSNE